MAEEEKKTFGIEDTVSCDSYLVIFKEYTRVKQMILDLPSVVEKSGKYVCVIGCSSYAESLCCILQVTFMTHLFFII